MSFREDLPPDERCLISNVPLINEINVGTTILNHPLVHHFYRWFFQHVTIPGGKHGIAGSGCSSCSAWTCLCPWPWPPRPVCASNWRRSLRSRCHRRPSDCTSWPWMRRTSCGWVVCYVCVSH